VNVLGGVAPRSMTRQVYPVNQVRRIGTTMQTRSQARSAADRAQTRIAAVLRGRRSRQQHSFQSRRMVPIPRAVYPPGYGVLPDPHDEL